MQSSKPVIHAGKLMLNRLFSFALDSREFSGRIVGDAYLSELIGTKRGTAAKPLRFASIASAKPNHDVFPAAVK